MPPKAIPPSTRFWPKVAKADVGCWEWLAAVDPKGYGRFGIQGSRTVLAHRFAYEECVGPIPPGLHIDHLCRNPGCVNPEHMEPVTPVENMRRGLAPLVGAPRFQREKTHCPRNHPYDEVNTYVVGGTKRQCRTCKADRQRERSYAKR